MSSTKKKRSSNAMDTSETTTESLIDIDFEAVAPTAHHFEGIRNLLDRMLHTDTTVNRSVLTDVVIRNAHVASVVVQCLTNDDEDDNDDDDDDDDDTVFGLMTVLNVSTSSLSEESESSAAKSELKSTLSLLQRHLQSLCVPSKRCELTKVLENKSNKVGLVVSERMLGIPVQIAAPLYEAFHKDLRKAGDRDDAFRFTHLIILSRILVADDQNHFAANAEEDALQQMADLVLDVHDEPSQESGQGEQPVKTSDAQCDQKMDNGDEEDEEDEDDEDDDQVLNVQRKILLFSVDKLEGMVATVKNLLAQ